MAADLVAKLVRRHPHVFDDAPIESDVHVQWDRLKNAEKQRASALDGVPLALGALARAQKIAGRAGRAGLSAPVPVGDGLGERLLALVLEADAAGVDAEGALRRTAAAWEQDLRSGEIAPGS